MPRNRKHAGTDLQTYTWEGVPRRLIQIAIVKCEQEKPPTSLKWKLIDLLEKWVNE